MADRAPRSVKQAACDGKRRAGRRRARRAARVLNDRQAEPVHAYPCPHCRHWHVGSSAWADWKERP